MNAMTEHLTSFAGGGVSKSEKMTRANGGAPVMKGKGLAGALWGVRSGGRNGGEAAVVLALHAGQVLLGCCQKSDWKRHKAAGCRKAQSKHVPKQDLYGVD